VQVLDCVINRITKEDSTEENTMRLAAHYLISVIGLVLYGVQVCPFIESMSSMALTAIIGSWLGLALLGRLFTQPAFVMSAPLLSRPGRQFILDFGLPCAAGIGMALFNQQFLGFPLLSGAKLMVGCLLFGFFIGADMALARERKNIEEAADLLQANPPATLFPVTRKFMLAAMSCMLLLSVVVIMVVIKDLDWLIAAGSTPQELTDAALAVAGEILFIMTVLMAVTMNLIFSYSRNLKLLFANQTEVLEDVASGNLQHKIPVATGDEFGLIAGRTNQMIDGLRHRIELMSALKVAEEVQGNLLPSQLPSLATIEAAGRSLYSDETGGDYFDAFPVGSSDARAAQGMLYAVGDVTGHGVGAALLMAAARAYLRMAAGERRGLDAVCSLLNDRLCEDVGNSGRFMTLFALVAETRPYKEPAGKTDGKSDGESGAGSGSDELWLRWTRAGHDPAIVYNPATDQFSELAGPGMALGVMEGFAYEEQSVPAPPPGSVLLIGTDGIWEAHAPQPRQFQPGQDSASSPEHGMFGKQRVRGILRRTAHKNAEQILQAVLDELAGFLGPAKAEDDITLVVLKFRK
jgi:sigma-B regulation protein RsbU (phosphoserine phosphatase)